jgi:acid stress-induced BolA-like protein IbaG/YrbA
MMFGSVSEHFANLRYVKRCKTCVSGVNALFQGTEVAKYPFYSIRPKMMFGSDSEHFANLRHVKTCVSGLNALFQGTEVAKHPFYSIRTEMMFGSVTEHFAKLRHVQRCKTCVLEHFANLRHVKRCKTCVSGLNALFQGTEVAKHQFYSIRPKWCLGVFQSISLTFGM